MLLASKTFASHRGLDKHAPTSTTPTADVCLPSLESDEAGGSKRCRTPECGRQAAGRLVYMRWTMSASGSDNVLITLVARSRHRFFRLPMKQCIVAYFCVLLTDALRDDDVITIPAVFKNKNKKNDAMRSEWKCSYRSVNSPRKYKRFWRWTRHDLKNKHPDMHSSLRN